jgi:hypothetical protein
MRRAVMIGVLLAACSEPPPVTYALPAQDAAGKAFLCPPPS